MMDYGMSTAALYDGGWRSKDEKEIQAFYGLTAEEAGRIAEGLQEIEKEENPGLYKTRYQAKKKARGNEVVVKVFGGYVIMDCGQYNIWKLQK